MEKPESNNESQIRELHFSVHTSVVFQLGESLISDVVQAIVELVKNSYDADSTFARVVVDTSASPGEASRYPEAKGYIIIEDDGTGMDYPTIEKGWLTISNSQKRKQKRENKLTVLGRTPLGDKGLGRLGSQRLGYNLEIITRPEKSNVEYHVAFSWRDFQKASRFSEVPIYVKTSPAKRVIGTTLIISDLRDKAYWSGDAASRLESDLSKMISPYKEVRNFSVAASVNGARLDLAEFTEKVRQTAQLRYQIDFDGNSFSVKGKARLDFFRPEKEEEKQQFKHLVEGDEGEEFFNFLTKKKNAEELHLQRAKAQGWFVTYSLKREFTDFPEMELVENGDANPAETANPGPFHAEVDSFDLGAESLRRNVFDRASEYKDYIKTLSGIRVYRDGFGIRVDPDWLKLGQQQTSGRSYYGLRPQNTIGYIALSAQYNAQLEEKTDREGFKVTPYYNNFYELMRQFVDFASKAQTFIRRQFNEFRKENQEKAADIEKGTKSEDISVKIRDSLSRAVAYKKVLSDLKGDLTEKIKETQGALKNVNNSLLNKDTTYRHQVRATEEALKSLFQAQKEIDKVNEYLDEVTDSNLAVGVLNTRFQMLNDQLYQFYETSSLGLTAEALSHEIHNIAEQLAYRTKQMVDYLRNRDIKDSRIITYIEYVNTAINGLRKQLAHLSPSLRYVREKREIIDVPDFFEETLDYYRERFDRLNIEVNLKLTKAKEFTLFMNKGKLVQVIDNLFINSEYWLREEIRLKRIKEGIITVEAAKPFIRISDNGPGIDPSIEFSLFDPFVTTKGRGKGRGLGLFIVQQLLDSEGCTISLLPKRNQHSRLYVFELDFTGALHGVN